MTDMYSGIVNLSGMLDFLNTLEQDVGVHTDGLSGDLNPDMAVEYLEGVVGGKAKESATPWGDYDGSGLYDPESLESIEGGENPKGRFQLRSQGLPEIRISYRFDFKVRDGIGKEMELTMTGVEEDYEGTYSDVEGAWMSKAFKEAGL